MQLTKQFKILEVRVTGVSNVPFQVVLEENPFRQEDKSILTFDADTLKRFGIAMSLNLVGSTLVCSFESRELLLETKGHVKGHVDMKAVTSDDLSIRALQRKEKISPLFGTIPPSKHVELLRKLTLSSFGGDDGFYLGSIPCPFYQLTIELTDEEYEACKALPPTSVFRVSFRLA